MPAIPAGPRVNTVADALHRAENAKSPAESVRWMFAAIKLQQQQIEQLEDGAFGQPEAVAHVHARAKARNDRRGAGDIPVV